MSEYIADRQNIFPYGAQKEEIVRCRECARSWVFDLSGLYDNHEHDQMYCALTVGHSRLVEPDGYCAWGERREDNE